MSTAVLSHQFPPVITQPDIALTILKGYLRSQEIPTQTLYWNFLLRRFYDRFVALRPDIYLQLRHNLELRELLFALGPFLLHLLKDENTHASPSKPRRVLRFPLPNDCGGASVVFGRIRRAVAQ
jgi:hypothetical protein